MQIPDWQLPAGVDRGLHDYMASTEMVAAYDTNMQRTALAGYDVAHCLRMLPGGGTILDVGCGTARLALPLTQAGYRYVGIDLSEPMLEVARRQPGTYHRINIAEHGELPESPFDAAVCLFSTLGMIRGIEERRQVLRNVRSWLKLGGTFILHIHNRWYHGLGTAGWRKGDVQRLQAYGGAPLTLHHYSLGEAHASMRHAGFSVRHVQPVGLNGALAQPWCLPTLRAYGFLITATATAS